MYKGVYCSIFYSIKWLLYCNKSENRVKNIIIKTMEYQEKKHIELSEISGIQNKENNVIVNMRVHLAAHTSWGHLPLKETSWEFLIKTIIA